MLKCKLKSLQILFLLFFSFLTPTIPCWSKTINATELFGPLSSTSVEPQSQLPTSLMPIMDDFIDLAREHRECPSKKIPVVAITGCPGVGKTYLIDLFYEELKRCHVSCAIVRFDDWTNPFRRGGWDYFNLQGVHDFFAMFLDGEQQIYKPCYDESTEQYSSEILDLREVDLIIFEGLLCLSAMGPINYFPYCDMGVFLVADPEDISNWKRARPNKVERSEEQFEQHMREIFAYYKMVIAPYMSNATWVISKDSLHNYSLERQY